MSTRADAGIGPIVHGVPRYSTLSQLPSSPSNGDIAAYPGGLLYYNGSLANPDWQPLHENARYYYFDGQTYQHFVQQERNVGGIIDTQDTKINEYHMCAVPLRRYNVGNLVSYVQSFRVQTEGWRMVAGDNDGEGAEWFWTDDTEGANSSHPFVFTVGTDACFIEAKIHIPTVSEYDVMAVGFRTAGGTASASAGASALESIKDDIACININAGDVNYVGRDSAGTATTDDLTATNFGNGEEHTLRIELDSSGNVDALYDGTSYSGELTVGSITAATQVTPFVQAIATGVGVVDSWAGFHTLKAGLL